MKNSTKVVKTRLVQQSKEILFSDAGQQADSSLVIVTYQSLRYHFKSSEECYWKFIFFAFCNAMVKSLSCRQNLIETVTECETFVYEKNKTRQCYLPGKTVFSWKINLEKK